MAKSVRGGFEEEETLYIRSSMEQQQQLCFLLRVEMEGFSTSWVTRFSTRASVLQNGVGGWVETVVASLGLYLGLVTPRQAIWVQRARHWNRPWTRVDKGALIYVVGHVPSQI